MSEFAQDDEEDDEAGDPAVELVIVNDLVAEQRDQKGRCGNDDDTRVARDVRVDGVEELRANNDIDGGPPDAGEDVEDGNEFHAVPAEIEA